MVIKALLPLLISTYFSGTPGLKVNQHHCCGKLVAWETLVGQQPKDCSGKVATSGKKCCSDKVQNLKADQGKQTLQKVLNHATSFTSLLPTEFYHCVLRFHSVWTEILNHFPNEPSESTKSVPLFLLYRSITI